MAGEVRLGEVAEIIMGQSPPGETYNENGEGLSFFQGVADFKYRWGSTEYIVLRPKLPLPDEFAYCLARGTEFRDFAIQSMTGSSGRQRVPAESLFHFRVVTAPKPIVGQFGQLIKPMFARPARQLRNPAHSPPCATGCCPSSSTGKSVRLTQ